MILRTTTCMHVYVRVSSGIAESCDWNSTASRGFGGMPTRLIVCKM